jgi:hypothetical protein
MRKSILRLVAILLIPCLTFEPVSGFSFLVSDSMAGSFTRNMLFASQALALKPDRIQVVKQLESLKLSLDRSGATSPKTLPPPVDMKPTGNHKFPRTYPHDLLLEVRNALMKMSLLRMQFGEGLLMTAVAGFPVDNMHKEAAGILAQEHPQFFDREGGESINSRRARSLRDAFRKVVESEPLAADLIVCRFLFGTSWPLTERIVNSGPKSVKTLIRNNLQKLRQSMEGSSVPDPSAGETTPGRIISYLAEVSQACLRAIVDTMDNYLPFAEIIQEVLLDNGKTAESLTGKERLAFDLLSSKFPVDTRKKTRGRSSIPDLSDGEATGLDTEKLPVAPKLVKKPGIKLSAFFFKDNSQLAHLEIDTHSLFKLITDPEQYLYYARRFEVGEITAFWETRILRESWGEIRLQERPIRAINEALANTAGAMKRDFVIFIFRINSEYVELRKGKYKVKNDLPPDGISDFFGLSHAGFLVSSSELSRQSGYREEHDKAAAQLHRETTPKKDSRLLPSA